MSLIGFKHAPAAVAFGLAVRNRPALLLARGFLGRRVDDAGASELGLVTGCAGDGFKAALRRSERLANDIEPSRLKGRRFWY